LPQTPISIARRQRSLLMRKIFTRLAIFFRCLARNSWRLRLKANDRARVVARAGKAARPEDAADVVEWAGWEDVGQVAAEAAAE
jgi:hypothetical protein